MKNILLTSILFVTALSCKDKDPEIACGCGSPTIKEINDVKSSYLGNGRFILRLTNPQGDIYEEINVACTIDSAWIKTTDISKPDYEITAKLNTACEQPSYSSYLPGKPIEITTIKRIL